MTTKPVYGEQYRYSTEGEMLRYRGLVGVASDITPCGTTWLLSLSNFKEWGLLGLSPVTIMATEIEPVETPRPVAVATDPDAFDGPEKVLVAAICKTLHDAGFETLPVGQHKAKGSGTTVGCPDMSVRRPSWPTGMACWLEVKTATGVLSSEQEALMAQGWSYIVRSAMGALIALSLFEQEVFAP